MTDTCEFPVSGAASLRARKLLGCAVVALGIAIGAPSAMAADECGVASGGGANCSGTTFPNGITYTSPTDLTITAASGTTVTTTAPGTNGITIVSGGSAALVGAANVSTTGAGSNGVIVVGGSGPVSVNTGTVTTVDGTGIVALNAGSGPLAVNAGPVTVGGSGNLGIVALASGPVIVTSAGVSTVDTPAIVALSVASPARVDVAGGSTVRSTLGDAIVIGSATDSTVNNNGTITSTTAAVRAIGPGHATVNNNGTINGALILPAPGTVVNNAGTFNAVGNSTFGANSRFANTGTVTVGANAVAPAAVTLTGLTTFNNAGTINLSNGRAGDTLTLPGNYVGSGNAALAIDVAPGAAVSVDQVLIGGSATGSTAVVVNRVAGVNPLFGSATIVQAGAGSSAGAFVIAPGSANAGLVGYDVVYNPGTGGYNIVASPSNAAYGLLRYNSALRNLWNNSADEISKHMQARRDSLWATGDGGATGKFWMTMSGSVERMRGLRDFSTLGQNRVTDMAYSQDYFGGQLGLDLSGGVGERGGFAFGITGGYTNSTMRLAGGPDAVNFDALNGGAYASFTSGNLFINGLAKYDYYWADAHSVIAGFDRRLHGHAWGARGELGMRFGSDKIFFEPVAQISWVDTSLDSFGVLGTTVDFNQRDGFRGKAGGRVGGVADLGGISRLSYYAGANYVHDFRREGDVTLSNAGGTYRVVGIRNPDAIEGVAGLTINTGRMVSGFMEVNYTHSFHNDELTGQTLQGIGGRAGLSFRF